MDIRNLSSALLLTIWLVACDSRPTVESEIRTYELEAQVAELETQLHNAQSDLNHLAADLMMHLRNLEAAIGEVERRVLDLPAGEPQFTIPEVEAAVALTKQRLTGMQGAAAEIAQYVAY